MRKTIKQLQGESDYWRVKFINEQKRAEAAELKLTELENFNRVDDKLKLVLTERLKAAEAKLAEIEKQEPAAFTSEHYWSELNDFGAVKCVLLKNGTDPDFQVELFTRPAPAVNLTPVSNCLSFFASVIKSGESWSETCQRALDAAREALRNLEGV